MSVRIRLTRTGRRNRPCHRLCAIDRQTRRDGRVLELLGLYDPLAPRVEDQLKLHNERVSYWISQGAELSVTARSLCERAGIELPTPKPASPRKRTRSPKKVAAKHARNATMHKAKTERQAARRARAKAKAEAAKAEAANK